jgi:uracil-DNA glycosylase
MTAPASPPDSTSLDALREAAASCTACDLAGPATQTVFGEGPRSAQVMLIGEQPGDQEDRTGHPFVGPAGRVLDRALEQSGIKRNGVYITNAVKHFRFERSVRGKQRLHKTPTTTQVRICAPWLQAEIRSVQPELLIALGATAAKSLCGPSFRITEARGQLRNVDVEQVSLPFLATIHPSAVLRADDREAALAGLVTDLTVAAQALEA